MEDHHAMELEGSEVGQSNNSDENPKSISVVCDHPLVMKVISLLSVPA